MKEKNKTVLMLKNAEGKRLLHKNRINYSKEIIDELTINPEILPQILEDLELSENDFFANISCENPANITFYDQTLVLVRKKNSSLKR